MKRARLLVWAAIVGLAVFSFIGTAQATCYVQGTVVRVLSYQGTSNYVYMRAYPLSSYYYYFYTSDSKLAQAAHNALTSQTRVAVSGNATSCPTSGTGRWMGVATYFITNP